MSLPFSSCPHILAFSDKSGSYSLEDLKIPENASALIYHCNAAVTYETEHQLFDAHAGSVLLLPPNCSFHATTFERASVILIAYYTAEIPAQTDLELIIMPITKRIRESFLQFTYLSQSAELGKELAMMTTFYNLLYYLHRYNKDADKQVRQNDLIRPSVAYLEKHDTVRSLNMKEIAALSGVSETHFRTLFTRQYGCTPAQFIAERRLKKATALLESTDQTVAEIANLCGFSDQYYFSRSFEKKLGCLPEEYRKKTTLQKR